MAAALQLGGELACETGEAFTIDMLTDVEAERRCRTDFGPTVQVLAESVQQSKDGTGQLPCGAFSIRIAAEDLPDSLSDADLDTFEQLLVDRYTRFAEAYPASIMKVSRNPDGATLRLSNWHDCVVCIDRQNWGMARSAF